MTLRLFLAIDLPDDLRSQLAVQQFLMPLPRREPVENLHLTLVFLGEVPEPQAQDLHDALSAFHAPPMTLTVEGFGLFGADRARLAYAALRPDPVLMALQSRLTALARRAGIQPEARRYIPHITLGRFPPQRGADALRLESAVALTAFRAEFRAREITLFRSDRSPHGSVYSALATYPLA